MPMLKVKCKTCNNDSDTGIACGEKALETLQLDNTAHTCSRGHSNLYDKKDYHF